MTGGRWLAIGVGTLTTSLAFWLAVLTLPSNRTLGLIVYGVSVAFGIYAIAGFSGASDIATAGFSGSLIALLVAGILALTASAIDSRPLLVAAPIVGVGLGGSVALAPTGDRARTFVRSAAVVASSVIAYLLFTVNATTYAFVGPLLPLPAVGLADRAYDRGEAVVREEPELGQRG